MNNPLLSNNTNLPLFSEIKTEHIEPAITQLLEEARAVVEQHLKATTKYTWGNLIEPLENVADKLNKAWSPISHMNSVVNTDELRSAYNACLPKLSAYSTEMGQNVGLFNAYKVIADSTEFETLDNAQKKIIQNALRDLDYQVLIWMMKKNNAIKILAKNFRALLATMKKTSWMPLMLGAKS